MKLSRLLMGLALCALFVACNSKKQEPVAQQTPTPAVEQPKSSEPIQILVAPTDLNPDKVALGEKLYNDVRLSKDNTLSCASCHDLKKGGTDQVPVSIGIHGIKGPINSPTVFNSGLNFVQFWDGRAKDLTEQASGPVNNPKEMGSNWDEVIAKLSKDTAFFEAFKKVYPDGLSGNNMADAIATFEKSLVTINSRFDQYLSGNAQAINDEEKRGYELFKNVGCVSCHMGPNMGGQMYQKMGVVKDYFADRGTPLTDADLGRFNVTHIESDKHFFKIPSLRVAALTAPYFHDASAKTLNEAVVTMAKYQLGRDLTPDETNAIVAFLKSVVGEYNGKALLQ